MMDDKFIISSLHDEKSKEIAEIIANKTARKILDYLTEKDASETDISKELNLPLSTVHYNTQKLLKTKLIEVKDYFWSEKGNKINIYRVARKLIVIAPKYARGYDTLKSIIPAILISAIFLIALFTIIYNTRLQQEAVIHSDLKKFSSLDEIKDFLKANTGSANLYGMLGSRQLETTAAPAAGAAEQAKSAEASEFSTTNIQVEGVDEADIVKNDGKYIYTISGNKVFIVDAYPAENAKIISTINMTDNPTGIFINNNRLIIFGYEQEYYPYPLMKETSTQEAKAVAGFIPQRHYTPKTFIRIYNIEDRVNPLLVRNLSFRGNYYDSRMIGDYVYAIINLPVQNYDEITVPAIYSGDEIREVKASDIYYFDYPDSSYIFTTINAININDDDSEISSKVFMMGYTQNMYVSQDNIYITYMKSQSSKYYYEKMIDDVYLEVVPEDIAARIKEIKGSNETSYKKIQGAGEIIQDYAETLDTEQRFDFQNNFEEKMQQFEADMERARQRTVIHRISINKDEIEHKAEGEVPGTVLNQFSMDEYQDYFRIATTTGSSWQREKEKNNVYVLDLDLKVTGRLEGLAEGERIYSARFLQGKVYLVTFRQIDPLFVISLANPEKPEVLGYLKIPGVSDYLHPYDENHIIGVGRDATEEGRITGMKLSLFDVSDVENPKEISKYIIGGRGTYSEALNDHKAFLFSKQKNLLVIPATIYDDYRYSWNGAYAFSLTLENGFELKGNVSHENESTNKPEYYYSWQSNIRRSIYMDNTLYTISEKMIKANSLENLQEISKLQLSEESIESTFPLLM